MDNLLDYIKSIEKNELNNFINNTNSDITIKKNSEKVISDTTWIDMVEESIPYLDNIIRNPRRFIVQEENIVPIAKAKVVTEESIKHLAQHTGLIQEVKEDGSIIPEKLLNVYREETVDLYENRFIKSLVDNLYQFVENKLNESDQRSYAKVKNQVTYTGNVNKKNEIVSVKLELTSNFEDEVDSSKDGHSLASRIEHIKEVIADFRSSTFIRSLKESAPVRSPIRKTNVILKEQNFIKALELWEYLEKNNIKPVTEVKKEDVVLKDEKIKEYYDLAFFIENDSLKEKKDVKHNISNDDLIKKLVNEYVFSGDVSEASFKKLMLKEFKEALRKKNKIKNAINNKYLSFVKEFDSNKKKAIALLK